MSARMKRKERPGQAVRRVFQGHLAKALAGLEKTDQPEAIHKVRKEIKRLRALLRLVREGLRRKEYRTMAHTLRLSAKTLAGPRDARVVYRAFDTLVQPVPGNLGALRGRMQADYTRAKQKFQDLDTALDACDLLRKARAEFRTLRLKRLEWRNLRRGVEASHRRGRKAYQLATRQPTTESLHAWRKQVKDLVYQMEFLGGAWQAKTRARLVALAKLGEAG